MKLGFCFLIKDGLSQLSLWERFLAPASQGSYGIYVHAKTPAPAPVLKGSSVDPAPLVTAWGDWSLVAATQRLFAAAMDDACDAMLLLSGDMLPLQPFDWIQAFCERTRISVQPSQGLSQQQRLANAERYAQIAPYFRLPINRLRKQNMFFVIQRHAVEQIAALPSRGTFPLAQLADEYYWVNHLIGLDADWQPSKVVFCNPDPTRTQALPMALTTELLRETRSSGFAFIRKITSVDDQSYLQLRSIYD